MALLQTALSHVVNLVLIGQSTSLYYDLLNETTAADMLVKLLHLPANQQHQRRLTLCNFSVLLDFLTGLYECAIFDWIVLNNLSLAGELVRRTLIRTFQLANETVDQRDDEDGPFLPLHQRNSHGVNGLTIELPGSFILKSALGVTGGDNSAGEAQSADGALFGLIRDNIRHLTEQQTSDMRDNLVWYADEDDDEEEIQAAFLWLLKVYEPKLNQSTEQLSWRTFDYKLCSPFVSRVLACYDGAASHGHYNYPHSDLGGDSPDSDSDYDCHYDGAFDYDGEYDDVYDLGD